MNAIGFTAARSTTPEIAPEEWQQRINLAACYRLVEYFGWTDLIYTHISARVPGEPGHFLLNRFGLLFHEVTASNLIKVDLDGNVIDDPAAPIHKAGFVIHSAIHGGREDVDCVIHTHSKAGVAVAAQKDGLLPLSQHAQLFYGRVSYHDYEGLAIDVDERTRLVRDLGRQCRDDPAQSRAAGGRPVDPAGVLQPVQSAIRLRDPGHGDGGQRRAQHPAAGSVGAHRQARRRSRRAVRHRVGGAAAHGRAPGSDVPDLAASVIPAERTKRARAGIHNHEIAGPQRNTNGIKG